MKYVAILLFAVLATGCNRDSFKESDYMKPITEETIKSTNGLDPNPRFDTYEARPPSETPGARGSSSDIEIQDASTTEENRSERDPN
jgi:hypothetical protein